MPLLPRWWGQRTSRQGLPGTRHRGSIRWMWRRDPGTDNLPIFPSQASRKNLEESRGFSYLSRRVGPRDMVCINVKIIIGCRAFGNVIHTTSVHNQPCSVRGFTTLQRVKPRNLDNTRDDAQVGAFRSRRLFVRRIFRDVLLLRSRLGSLFIRHWFRLTCATQCWVPNTILTALLIKLVTNNVSHLSTS